MKYIIDIEGKLTYLNKYPRVNLSEEINGFNGKIYVLIDNKPSYTDFDILTKSEIRFTDELHEGYEHILIAYQDYLSVQRPVEEIAEIISNDLAEYLDSEYPVWERDKHTREILLEKANTDKDKYIRDLDKWLDDCRAERDKKEDDYNDKGTIPILGNYPTKPINNLKT